MGGFWQSPEAQGGVIPFAVALVLALALRLAGGRGWGARLAILAPGLGFLVGYYLIEGASWPAVASKQKVLWLAVIALALGLLVEIAGRRRAATLAIAHLFPLGALAWLDWNRLAGGPSGERVLTWAVLYAATVVILWSLWSTARRGRGAVAEASAQLPADDRPTDDAPADDAPSGGAIDAAVLLMVAGFAGGAISIYSAFIGMAQASVAVGAALGGYLLVAYVFFAATGRAPAFGAIGLVGIAGIWLTCLYVMVLFGFSMNKVALAILWLSFPASWLAGRIRIGAGRTARIVEPVLRGVVVAIPAVAGAAYAIVTAAPGVVE